MIKHVEHHVGTDNIYWNDEKNIVFDDENTVNENLRDPWSICNTVTVFIKITKEDVNCHS